MALKLEFQISLDSDYHISAGHGRGAVVDSALLRDADNAPVIRGTTLTGLLRDGLWRLLQLPPMREKYRRCQNSNPKLGEDAPRYCGQESTEETPELCPICRLFGTPRAPKRWRIRSARPSEPSSHDQGQVVQRVRISPRTRRVEPRKLFSQEDGDAQWTFTFTAICPVNDESAQDEAALLVAAARNVRQLGRSRRRGQGECLFSLIKVEGMKEDDDEDWQTALLDRFAQKWPNGSPAAPGQSKKPFEGLGTAAGGDPVLVRLIVRADEPLLIAGRAEAGNQIETLPYVTGQTVRGALAWRAAQRYKLEPDGPGYRDFVDTFLRQQIHFPFLYPAVYHDGILRPTIPAPQDLLTCKNARGNPPYGHGIWFASRGDVPQDGKCDKCGSPLKTVKDLVSLYEFHWERDFGFHHAPKRSTEMHVHIDPEYGRAAQGDLFGYVTLDARQYFVGDLYCQSRADWNRLKALAGLEEQSAIPLHLGKAAQRGYGKVTAWFELIDDSKDSWRRQTLVERVGKADNTLRLTLLTDTIVTDRWGRYATGFAVDWLQRELGVDIEDINYAAAVTRIVDGFNSHLGLPRWRDVAMAAGSTVYLQLEAPAALDPLRQLEEKGIGLRRNEGFGQITFNHPVYQECKGISAGIQLDGDMKPESTSSSLSPLDDWKKTLDKAPWRKCSKPPFTAVARWLHSRRYEPPTKLQQELSSLGALPDEAIELLGKEGKGEEEYGKRHTFKPKEDRLTEMKGISIIQKLLEKLAQEEQDFWPQGIIMLADRVAGAVDKEAK